MAYFIKGVKQTRQEILRRSLKQVGKEICWDDREKKSKKLKGIALKPETIEKMKAHKKSEEHKRKISQALKGKAKSFQHRIKLSEANKNNPKLKVPRKVTKEKNHAIAAGHGNPLHWLEQYL